MSFTPALSTNTNTQLKDTPLTSSWMQEMLMKIDSLCLPQMSRESLNTTLTPLKPGNRESMLTLISLLRSSLLITISNQMRKILVWEFTLPQLNRLILLSWVVMMLLGIGEITMEWLQLRIKEVVDHAGLLPQLEHLKPTISSIMELQSSSLSNNWLTVQEDKATWVAMEDGKHGLSTTLMLKEVLNQKTVIHIRQEIRTVLILLL